MAEKFLRTAGNKIICARCTARSKRSGEQCRKPALRASRTQKCQLHGGKSRGAVTIEGREKSAAANHKTGQYSQIRIGRDDRIRALIRVLEGASHLLEMVPANTSLIRGRKPKLHLDVTCQGDIAQTILSLQE